MNRYLSALRLAAIVIPIALTTPSTAHTTVSQQAAELLNLDSTESQYEAIYESVLAAYTDPASEYSLSFSD